MYIKEKPVYKAIYQNELAEELTGIDIKTIQQYMRRKDITLAEAILYYIHKRA